MSTTFTKIDKTKIPVAEIGNALTSISDDHILGTAGDIYDTDFGNGGAYQSEINKYLNNKFSNYLPLTGGSIKGTVHILDDDNGKLISLGTNYNGIQIGTDDSAYKINIGSGLINIGYDDSGIKIGYRNSGTAEISIGSGSNKISIGSGKISMGSDISLGSGTITVGSGSNKISVGSGMITVGSDIIIVAEEITTPKIKFNKGYISDDGLVLGDWANMNKDALSIGTVTTQTYIKGKNIKMWSVTPIVVKDISGVTKCDLSIGTESIKFINDGNTHTELTQGGLRLSGTDSFVELHETADDYYSTSIHYPRTSYITYNDLVNGSSNTLRMDADRIELERWDNVNSKQYISGITADGLMYPLTVLYRDVENNPVEFEYKAGNPVEGDINTPEIPGNNLNTIDLSRGVYYATTSKTATRVSNGLTIRTGEGEDDVITYNGQEKQEINISPEGIGAAPATHDHDTVYSKLEHHHNDEYSPLGHGHSYAGSKTDGGAANKVENKLTLNVNGTNTEFDGSAAKTVSINATSVGAAPTNHNHDTVYSKLEHHHNDKYSELGHGHSYAGSKTDGGAANKVENKLTLNVNGTNTEFDGSAAKTVSINASSIGAAPTSHNHDTVYSKLNHNHDDVYSKLNHNHDDVYAKKDWVDEELSNKLGKTEKAASAYSADSASTAETANVSNKVSHPLTLKQGNFVINYDGQLNETFDIILLKEITYSELKTLKDNNELMPGQLYRITDYVTTTNGNEYSSSAGHSFDIIVEAITSNTLNENARACHPKYFNDSVIPESPASSDKMLSNVSVAPDVWVNISNDEFTNELQTLLANNSISNPVTDNVRKICITEYNNGAGGGYKIDCKAGNIVVKFKWQTNSGSKKVNMCGVTLKDAVTDTVVSADYHIGSTGTYDVNNKYLLNVPKDGEYYIDCFIIKHANYDGGEIDSTVAISAYQLTSYFENSKLLSWDIKYCLENDSNRFKWAKSDGKGVIYYMKDEYNNQASFDFKNILFFNKYVFNYTINNVNYDGTVNYGNTVCYDNSIGLDISNGLLGLPQIYFNNTATNAECHNNIIEKNCWKITFGSGCFNNTVYNNSEEITFGDGCTHNTIYQNCKTNSFGKNSSFNVLYQGCKNNTFGESCSNNILNEGCLRNTFGVQNINNVLSNDCTDNYFGDNCCDNMMGRMCSNNRFAGSCSSNTFKDNCTNNIFDLHCDSNVFGSGCVYNEFGNNCYDNIFKDDCGYSSKKNIFGNYCYANEFGKMCRGIVFGDNGSQNKFGNYCWDDKFGTNVSANTFGIDCSNIEIRKYNSEQLLDYICGFEFGNYCKKLYIYPPCEISPAYKQELQNFKFSNDLGNTSQYTNIVLEGTAENLLYRKYITNIAKNSAGEIVQKCLMDVNVYDSYDKGKLTISFV